MAAVGSPERCGTGRISDRREPAETAGGSHDVPTLVILGGADPLIAPDADRRTAASP